jgi:hypothetical protein
MLETPESKTKRSLIFFLVVGGIFLFVTIVGSNYVLTPKNRSSNIGEIIPGLNGMNNESTRKTANAAKPPILTINDIDLPIQCEPIKIDQGNLISCKGNFNIKVENGTLPEKGARIKLVKYQENTSKNPRVESAEFTCVLQPDQNLLLCDMRPKDIESGQYFTDLIFGDQTILNVVEGLITIN